MQRPSRLRICTWVCYKDKAGGAGSTARTTTKPTNSPKHARQESGRAKRQRRHPPTRSGQSTPKAQHLRYVSGRRATRKRRRAPANNACEPQPPPGARVSSRCFRRGMHALRTSPRVRHVSMRVVSTVCGGCLDVMPRALEVWCRWTRLGGRLRTASVA